MSTHSGTKRILIVDFMYPLPENIGRRMRTMNFVRFFRKYGLVDLLYFHTESETVEEKDAFNKEFYIRHPSYAGEKERSWNEKVAGRLGRLLKKRPWMVTDWPSVARNEYVSIINQGNYDMVFCRYILETDPLFQLTEEQKRRIILDYDDVFSESLFGFHAKHLSKISLTIKDSIQRYFLLNYERKCLDFGVVLFTTQHDKEQVAGKNNRRNAFVVPNIYPCNQIKEEIGSGYPNLNTFLFIGALNYGPNVEGLKWFVETIFQPVRKCLENSRLLVVGRQPSSEVRAICDSVPQIELHPDVPDVTSYYRESGIVVVPILTAGGTRIKILEAGIAGRPVVSTPMGAYGLDATDGKDLLLFNDKNTFLECLGKLRHKSTYESISANMKSLVKHTYSPESFNRTMEEAIHHLM